MRQIAKLENQEKARIFGDYLFSQGIDNSVEKERSGDWAVWVHSEEEIDNAAGLLDAFLENPDNPLYRHARRRALAKRAEAEKAAEKARKRHVDIGRRRRERKSSVATVTIFLIALSVAVTLGVVMRGDEPVVRRLQISESPGGLPEVRSGEVWRLVTPILLHFGFLHIVFNMLWLNELGGMVERRQGHFYLAIMVLVLAVGSNLGQFAFSGPRFGGMSGVVYGLLAYVWLRGKRQPSFGLFVSGHTMTLMIAWYLLCLVGVIPNVANAAHTVGLLIGGAWAFAASALPKR